VNARVNEVATHRYERCRETSETNLRERKSEPSRRCPLCRGTYRPWGVGVHDVWGDVSTMWWNQTLPGGQALQTQILGFIFERKQCFFAGSRLEYERIASAELLDHQPLQLKTLQKPVISTLHGCFYRSTSTMTTRRRPKLATIANKVAPANIVRIMFQPAPWKRRNPTMSGPLAPNM
jgi:hypothetical protein